MSTDRSLPFGLLFWDKSPELQEEIKMKQDYDPKMQTSITFSENERHGSVRRAFTTARLSTMCGLDMAHGVDHGHRI